LDGGSIDVFTWTRPAISVRLGSVEGLGLSGVWGKGIGVGFSPCGMLFKLFARNKAFFRSLFSPCRTVSSNSRLLPQAAKLSSANLHVVENTFDG
jgi:hypothetical protein